MPQSVENTIYFDLLDELIEMSRIRRILGLSELTAPSTLCEAFNWLDMVWLLYLLSLRRYSRRAALLELLRQDSTAVMLRNTTRNELNSPFNSSK